MRRLFDALYLLLLTITLPYWLWKAATVGKYRHGIAARFFGAAPTLAGTGPRLWVHAVSVGEVLLLRPLYCRLCNEHPDWQWALSVTTDAGLELARQTYPEVAVFRAPLDFSWATDRVLRTLRPRVMCLVELELWPNVLLAARRAGTPVLVANARMGERSHRGYRRIRWLLRPALSAIRWWGAQSEIMATRIRDLTEGLATELAVTGSMKYDQALQNPDNPATRQLGAALGIGPSERVLVGGSTQGNEEEMLLDAFEQLREKHAELKLVIVPRHPERFEAVAKLLRRRGVDFARRSESPQAVAAKVLLIDTVGELGAAWGLATVGYVGGTMACGRGGQNMLEPAGYGVPACFGPEVWNFQDTADRLRQARGAELARTPAEVFGILSAWLADPELARATGARARAFIESQQGAVETTAAALTRFMTR